MSIVQGLYTGPILMPHPTIPNLSVPFWAFPLDPLDSIVFAILDPLTDEVVYIAEGSVPHITTKTLLEGRNWMKQWATPAFLAWGQTVDLNDVPMVLLDTQVDYDRYWKLSGYIRDFWAAGAPLLNKLPRKVSVEERLERLLQADFVALRKLADAVQDTREIPTLSPGEATTPDVLI